jgi:hypothetical protein
MIAEGVSSAPVLSGALEMGGIIGKLLYDLQRFYKRKEKFFFPVGPDRPARTRMRADSGEEQKAPMGLVSSAQTSLRKAPMSCRRFGLPDPPPPAPAAGAFMMMPAANLTPQQWAWQCALYEWALSAAQAVVQPTIVERDLLGAWN